ncbi:LexA family transcriptional regulator [Acinetobacter pollinis]|uniref:Helix-turn-helix domain-containing protein n=1 Tax=Acinetobacter pollinis TaxID=2605270 RepID=A0ABU6DUT5_9GAMM|nr:S24 family peptidase [Acinetobacter pollinis]MEB5477615.1 helix-turn-helix domain-containing protein [Acinetobacter pollinis]
MSDLAKTRRKNTLRLLAEKMMSKKMLAEGIGVTPPLISAYLSKNPHKAMGDNLAAKICNFLGVTLRELDTDQDFIDSIIRDSAPIFSDSAIKTEDKYVLIPLFKNVKPSYRNNYLNDNNQEVEMIPFDGKKLLIRRILKNNVQALITNGDSMLPIIPHGAQVFLDRTRNTVQRDGLIYVICMGELVLVKYLFRLPNHGLRIVSANSNKDLYPDVILSKDDVNSDNFHIIGQVFHVDYELPF